MKIFSSRIYNWNKSKYVKFKIHYLQFQSNLLIFENFQQNIFFLIIVILFI